MFNIEDFQKSRQGTFGKELHHFAQLDSTNRVAEELARKGSAEGVLVVTDEQTTGRGRKGNAWYSPPDENLYFTLILRPFEARLHHVPFIAGLAIVRMLSRISIEAELKWPNDVLAGGKKISGLLIQTSIEQNRLQYALLGCGLNVNTHSFPGQLMEKATSIRILKGDGVLREHVLASLLFEFEQLYGRIQEMSWSDLCRQVESASSMVRNCEVVVQENGKTYQGITHGLDPFGGLIVQLPEGRRIFYAGDIQSCRKN
jgi:BirA family biotin operon repressor/biotin-[acetyl-CoA-carboxylase] ligase